MKMRLAVAIVLLIGCKSKAADPPSDPPQKVPAPEAAPKEAPNKPYRMATEPKEGCGKVGFKSLDALKMKVQLEIPATVEILDLNDPTPGGRIDDGKGLGKSIWALVVKAAAADDDFAKEKATIESNAKEQSLTLKWTKSEQSADGYRFAYTITQPTNKDDEPSYLVTYLRTIEGKKYRCSSYSLVDVSLDCAMRACDSLKAL